MSSEMKESADHQLDGNEDNHAKETDSPTAAAVGESWETPADPLEDDFDIFDECWAAADPHRAPRLTRATDAGQERSATEETRAAQSPVGTVSGAFVASHLIPVDDRTTRRLNAISEFKRQKNFAQRFVAPMETLPFHHLVSFAPLAAAFMQSEATAAIVATDPTDNAIDARHQFYRQILTARGVPANEAALFDDVVRCRLTGRTAGRLRFLDWLVTLPDALAGSAETYRAELLFFKRRVYEAGDDLRTFIEIGESELPVYFGGTWLADLPAERLTKLLLDALDAGFTVDSGTLATGEIDNTTGTRISESHQRTRRRQPSASLSPDAPYSTGSSRVDFRVASDDEECGINQPLVGGLDHLTANFGGRRFRLKLNDYWSGWQRAACAAGFDFDYLETVADARALRFYELTKLWRASTKGAAAKQLPLRMEITYKLLAALLPLPILRSESQIRGQITQMVEQLEGNNYIRRFTFRSDELMSDWKSRIVFEFAN